MHALMFEISWPLPWEVSVPSFNKTICGSVVFFFQNAEWRKEEKRFSDEIVCVCVCCGHSCASKNDARSTTTLMNSRFHTSGKREREREREKGSGGETTSNSLNKQKEKKSRRRRLSLSLFIR
jgi:hypothetical protein